MQVEFRVKGRRCNLSRELKRSQSTAQSPVGSSFALAIHRNFTGQGTKSRRQREGMEGLAGAPHLVHDDGNLAGQGNHGTLARIARAGGSGLGQSPLAQRRVFAVWP